MQPLAYVEFTDHVRRPVFELAGRQTVEDDDGEPIFGVWYVPREDWEGLFGEQPIIIEAMGNGRH